MARAVPSLADERTPSRALGLAVATGAVAAVTLVDFALDDIAPPVSLGVVYLLAVLLVSTFWEPWLGMVTAVASALAFNFFHLPPTGRFTIAAGENWVALAVFFVAAVITSTVAESWRRRARAAEQRRREADLAVELARLLLRGELRDGLPVAAQRLALALALPSAAIELRPVEGDDRRVAFALRDGARQIGTLVVPAGLPEGKLRRLQERVVPSLEALLVAALERDELLGDVVETRALRRSDVVKTALLRAVSHDLRSPLTAILAAAEPLGGERVDDAERRELAGIVAMEAERLSRLIEQLLDLSRLEAGGAEARPQWSDLGEVVHAAADELHLEDGAVRVQVAADTPLLRFDPVQLQRALVNLLGNAARYAEGHPVQVRAAPAPGRVLIRVVDQGPGIPQAQRERVFEPFYRAGTDRTGYRGSGLGLAIARGFIEANGGRIWAESLPGQGTTFVVEMPLPDAEPAPRSGVSRARPHRRRRAPDPARPAHRAPRRRLRGRARRDRAGGAGPRRAAAAGRGDHRPRAARRRRRRRVTRSLREWSSMPIVVLSAIGEEDEKVRALEAGADDYVTKPFGPRELVARLQAVLRRVAPEPDDPVLRAEGLELDLAAHVVALEGAEVHLTPIEFELLARSCATAAACSRTARSSPRCGARPTPTTCDAAHPHREPPPQDRGRAAGPRYVRTEPGVGYRFALMRR